MTNPKGWHRVTAATVGPIVTIADLVAVTGLSRWTIRQMLTRYQVTPLPRHGGRDTRRYERHLVMTAIDAMPGSGRRITKP
jgi:hypothetical protein